MTKQAKRARQTKPKCVKGTACGYSCISGKLTCSSRILERDAAELVASVQAKPAKAKAEAESYSLDQVPSYSQRYDSLAIAKTLQVGKDTVEVDVAVTDGASLDFAFKVNSSYDADLFGPSEGNGVKVAMSAMREMQSIVKQLPDGVLVRNAPYMEDGMFESRVSLYKRAGFSDFNEDTSEQYGVVYKGKIRPLTYDEFTDRILEHPDYEV